MKTLYLECNMGAAGDMLMAALTELMPDKDVFVKELNDLQIPQVNIERTTIAKCGIMGTPIVGSALPRWLFRAAISDWTGNFDRVVFALTMSLFGRILLRPGPNGFGLSLTFRYLCRR